MEEGPTDSDDQEVNDGRNTENTDPTEARKEAALSSMFQVHILTFNLTLAISLGSNVPGCGRSYQEVCTEYVRDYLIQNQIEYKDVVASQVVDLIRVSME